MKFSKFIFNFWHRQWSKTFQIESSNSVEILVKLGLFWYLRLQFNWLQLEKDFPTTNQNLFSEKTEEKNNLNVFNQQSNTSSGQFSLLSAFGQSKETESNEPESNDLNVVEENASEAFALKLKEKAANEASAKG